MKLTLVLIAIVFISTSSSEVQTKKSYKDHKVVSLRIENDSQLKELQALELEKGFVFLDPPVQVNMKLELVIQPEMFGSFNEIATQHQINFEVTTDNLQSWIDEEKPLKSRKDGFAHDKFNTLEEIHQYLDELAEQHQTATVINIGKSYEGRDIKGIKITTNSNNPAIFIEANIHAREWISSAAAMWIANEILTTQDAEIKEVVESLTWYIIPVTNPDGFVYTHEYERLWRKSRSVHNILCHGVDTNRNFGYNFKQGGSSSLACTDTYAGPSAMSEPEAVAIMNFYATIANQTDAYISFHCAAEVILYPMGTSGDPALLHNAQDLYDIAEAASEGLKKKHGSVYAFGNVVELLYVASGSSPDHAYGVYGTPIAYTFELRGGTTTSSRFILPPEEIEANSEEVLDALVAMVVKAKSLGYFQVRT